MKLALKVAFVYDTSRGAFTALLENGTSIPVSVATSPRESHCDISGKLGASLDLFRRQLTVHKTPKERHYSLANGPDGRPSLLPVMKPSQLSLEDLGL